MTSLRSFWILLSGLAVVVTAGSLIYAQQQHIPSSVVTAVAPALFLELAFYLSTGFVAVRERLAALRPLTLSAVLLISAVLPAFYPALLGTFEWRDVAILLALAGVVVAWYHVLPRTPVSDLALMAVLAAVILLKGRFFRDLYPDAGSVRLDFLGHLMWIRLFILVMLLVRRAEGIGYGFWPTPGEWRIGARQFVVALPFVASTGFALGNMRLGTPNVAPALLPLYALAAFIAVFMVVALSEEFLLRGVVLRRLIGMTRSIPTAMLITAVISGLVHLPFRGPWNWKFAIVSAVAHWFFGQAFLEGKSVRASMVTHALVVTTWFVAFGKSA